MVSGLSSRKPGGPWTIQNISPLMPGEPWAMDNDSVSMGTLNPR